MGKTWTWPKIKCAIEERGMTLTGLAELNGITPSLFRSVRTKTHRPSEKAIADFIGVKPAELFPDRYPIRKSRILSAENADLIARAKAKREADKANAA